MSDTKKSILLSALGLFARDGYEAVPVSAIAGELGITKGALYKHYKNKAQFRYWTQDSFASSFRRMLTLEQYRSPEMGRLYQQYLVSGPLGYVADIFGSLGYADPMEKALGFYGPMFLMYSVYDGAEAKDGIIAAADSYLEKAGNRLREEKNI